MNAEMKDGNAKNDLRASGVKSEQTVNTMDNDVFGNMKVTFVKQDMLLKNEVGYEEKEEQPMQVEQEEDKVKPVVVDQQPDQFAKSKIGDCMIM